MQFVHAAGRRYSNGVPQEPRILQKPEYMHHIERHLWVAKPGALSATGAGAAGELRSTWKEVRTPRCYDRETLWAQFQEPAVTSWNERQRAYT